MIAWNFQRIVGTCQFRVPWFGYPCGYSSLTKNRVHYEYYHLGMTENVPELEGFHFHTLRHTYTTNLLSNGAQPKDVQELLGHSDVSTIMNVYAHATREAKRTSARLLDKVAGND